MKQRLTAILLVLFSKHYIVVGDNQMEVHAPPHLIDNAIVHLDEVYDEYNLQEEAVQEFYDVLNCGK